MKSCTVPAPYGVDALPVNGAGQHLPQQRQLPRDVAVRPPLADHLAHLRRVDAAGDVDASVGDHLRERRRAPAPAVITGEQIRTRRCARADRLRDPVRERPRRGPGVNQAPRRRRVTGRGSTKPLCSTSPRRQSCSKSSVNAFASAGESTIDDHVLLRATTSRRSSSSSRSRPTRRRGRRTCGASGRGRRRSACAGTRQRRDQLRVGLRRRRHRDRVRVVDVVGEPDRARRARPRVLIASPTIAAVSGAEVEVVLREVERVLRAVEERGDARARSRAGCWPPSVRVRMRDARRSSSARRAPGSATTFNFYRDGDRAPRCGATGSRALPRGARATRRSCSSARRRATAARASPGIPFTSERQLTGRGPGRGDARRSSTACSPSSGSRTSVLLWNVVPTHPRPARPSSNRAPDPRRDRRRPAVRCASSRAGRRVVAVGRVAQAALGGAVRPAPVPRRRGRVPYAGCYHSPPADERVRRFSA